VRKALIVGSAAYLLLLWALLAAVLVIKSHDGMQIHANLLFLWPPVFLTGASVVLQRRAWRSEVGLVTAVLVSLGTAVTVLALLILASLAGD
jgi:hypothetical protein